MSHYWGKGYIAIVMVRKNVTLLRENRDVAMVRLSNDVT